MTPRKASLIKSNKIRKNKDNKTDDKSHEGAKKVKQTILRPDKHMSDYSPEQLRRLSEEYNTMRKEIPGLISEEDKYRNLIFHIGVMCLGVIVFLAVRSVLQYF